MNDVCDCPDRKLIPLYDELLALSGQAVLVGAWCPVCDNVLILRRLVSWRLALSKRGDGR